MKKSLNAISRKPKGFKQSYLDARFSTPECTLTATQYLVENFKFGSIFSYLKFFEKKNEKTHKKRQFSKNKRI